MFNSLLGPKFSNKCKHSVKCIKCRMETIRKKKHAMERCLKKDIADLVSTGHDANAFGRMDALLFEINQISCYEMIEQYCCCILEHLPAMQKERECPKETVEAVATLIFAAARFSDLPELADLRRGFTERYRTSMESYTNKEFVEKSQKKSFTQDEKLRLMKDIAKEFNIDWDVRSFEYKMSNPSALIIDHSKVYFRSSNKNYIESHITDERRKVTDRKNEVVNGRKQHIEFEKLKTVNNNETQKIIQIEGDEHHSRSAAQKHRAQTEDHRKFPKALTNANAHDSTEKIKKVAADESESFESRHLSGRPPPYVKTIGNQNGNARKRSEDHEASGLVLTERRGATRNDEAIAEEVVKEIEHNAQQRQPNGAVNSESKRGSNLKPPYVKPRVKSLLETGYVKSTNYEITSRCDNGGYNKNTAYSVRRRKLEQGTAAHAGSAGEDDPIVEKTIEGEGYSKLAAQTPTRTVSLPPTEALVGRHARSVTLNPNLWSSNGEGLYPRLPDYDDLAARIAALRKP